jgi:hypothetical protein
MFGKKNLNNLFSWRRSGSIPISKAMTGIHSHVNVHARLSVNIRAHVVPTVYTVVRRRCRCQCRCTCPCPEACPMQHEHEHENEHKRELEYEHKNEHECKII